LHRIVKGEALCRAGIINAIEDKQIIGFKKVLNTPHSIREQFYK
jgi:hypothetical protein